MTQLGRLWTDLQAVVSARQVAAGRRLSSVVHWPLQQYHNFTVNIHDRPNVHCHLQITVCIKSDRHIHTVWKKDQNVLRNLFYRTRATLMTFGV